jgi:glutamate/tyrosine decarboxylase-like PLP-dependent enzyme
MTSILTDAAQRADRYLNGLASRRVFPSGEAVHALGRFAQSLPEAGEAAETVIRDLDEIGSPATVASASGRYFGFVIGSGLPVSLAANWLANAWNQNAGLDVMSPVSARLEETALDWTRDVLGLPPGIAGAFVTGDTMANFTALAAARHEVLARVGYDLESQGMSGAPPITVIVGEEVHASVVRVISLLGFGRDRVKKAPVDAQGRMIPTKLPPISGPTIVCTQAGNVNSGAFDPLREIGDLAHEVGAWVHVDGAFGLWARAAPGRRALADGAEVADSWAVDCHKWLNVPYDSAIVFVRNERALRNAFAFGPAAYLAADKLGNRFELTPEMSRRSRGVDAWAAMRYLGRSGIAELVERCCRHAERFASRLREAGFQILNDVVLNQVLVSFGDDATTRGVIEKVQRDGTCWCGGTDWHGRTAMRISVSSWATTEEDVDRCVTAMIRLAKG